MKRLFLLVICGLTGAVLCFAQGSLTPTMDALNEFGEPIASMKSLDQVEPRQVIYALPFVIEQPGSYYISRTLDGVALANGITIITNDVQLDLAGFSLNGVDGSLSGIAVFPPNLENITIRNGIVRGWGKFGINATNARDVVVSNVKASHNKWGGIYLGENAYVEKCSAYGNGHSAPFEGYEPPVDGGIYTRSYGTVLECIVRYNRGAGIYVWDHSKVLGCNANGSPNADGIRAASYCTIRDCVAAKNWSNGIHVDSMSRVIENTAGDNGKKPPNNFNPDAAGIEARGSHNIIEKNLVVNNSIGIKTTGDGNLIINNSASSNTNNFNFYGQVHRGLVVTADGVITETNPWANFQFE